jgi:hypothetical protein
MRKLSFLLLAVCLCIFLPTNASSGEVYETSVEILTVAGKIAFISSFCNCLDGNIVAAQITSTNSAVLVDNLIFTKTDSHWESNQSSRNQFAVNAYACLRLNIS